MSDKKIALEKLKELELIKNLGTELTLKELQILKQAINKIINNL